MNITVLGAGAIGSLWAYKLAEAGHNVSVWTRDTTQTRFAIELDEKPLKQFTANSFDTLADSDLLLITVKAWQVRKALLPILNRLHSETILVFMHNGMGAVDEIKAEIERFPVVLATTTQAAYKPNANKVLHTGNGSTQLGAYNTAGKQCAFLAEVFQHALPEVSWNKNISNALWNKLAINCAINPLTAIYQITNGELSEEEYQPSLEKVVEEVSLVMSAEGIETDQFALLEKVKAVISATARNHSSMQQDIYHQRRSEIDYINGYLCRTADRHAIDAPENKKLYNQIKQIEQGWK
ncbi:2-dehydropantoate 2-reductase [Vibrio hannami]|uniref:2-dehydropantoate 2-reductase n=1 Tax=Vibrio hannami TaxID=2717094 RepID=UPI00240F26EF|nr:2-dehydropantoate 2-reductase [Vibrio hannami]MDG3087364.1 2-dehydropantoate 2-reductase [Vibrio hannami]